VELDAAAGQAALAHAQAMQAGDFFSHWDTTGEKPTRRWNLLGGFDALSENIYFYRGPSSGYQQLIDEAMKTLMNSPGHRATIMDPAHTNVGLGFVYDDHTKSFYVDQEFVTRAGGDYSCPLAAHVGDKVEFAGRFDSSRYDFENVIMGYEESAVPRSQKWLNSTESYRDADRLVAGFSTDPHVRFNGLASYSSVSCAPDGHFSCDADLNFKGAPGLYYLFLWLRDKHTGQPFVAATATVEARR